MMMIYIFYILGFIKIVNPKTSAQQYNIVIINVIFFFLLAGSLTHARTHARTLQSPSQRECWPTARRGARFSSWLVYIIISYCIIRYYCVYLREFIFFLLLSLLLLLLYNIFMYFFHKETDTRTKKDTAMRVYIKRPLHPVKMYNILSHALHDGDIPHPPHPRITPQPGQVYYYYCYYNTYIYILCARVKRLSGA